MASSINASTSGAGGVITTADNTGILNIQTGGTTAVTVDASQNVGIGTTAGITTVTSGLAINNATATNSPGIEFQTAGVTRMYVNANNSASYIVSIGSNPLVTYTNGSERMRIDSSGNVLVGTTTAATLAGTVPSFQAYTASGSAKFIAGFNNASTNDPVGIVISYTGMTRNTAGSEFIYCNDTSALRMSVRSNGGIANYSANNVNLSDERLKTDILPATTYLDKICSIPVVTFKYKDQTDEELNLGVIAQEVDKVAPELVDHSGFGEAPEGESPYLAIYQTDLQYALMKCIQEQQTIINDLKARVTALEAK